MIFETVDTFTFETHGSRGSRRIGQQTMTEQEAKDRAISFNFFTGKQANQRMTVQRSDGTYLSIEPPLAHFPRRTK